MKAVVIGAGFAGAVAAEQLALAGYHVELYEKRGQIAGNMFDFIDSNGVLCHQYGPHLFRTDDDNVWEYISRFAQWYTYPNTTSVFIDGKYVHQPFNLNAIEILLGEEVALQTESAMTKRYGSREEIPVLELFNSDDEVLRKVAKFFYEKDYLPYTQKQWGLSPLEVDPSVTARVPIRNNRDNRLFLQKYCCLPKGGYSELFKNLLSNSKIKVMLNTDALEHIRVDMDSRQIYVDGQRFSGPIIYSGAVDELMTCQFGALPYRSLEFAYESCPVKLYQPTLGVVYPGAEINYTRIIEYKHLMENSEGLSSTTIVKEFPMNYEGPTAKRGNIPYYPMMTEQATSLYNQYKKELSKLPNLFLIGRLAEYKYYYMDQVIAKAIDVVQRITDTEGKPL